MIVNVTAVIVSFCPADADPFICEYDFEIHVSEDFYRFCGRLSLGICPSIIVKYVIARETKVL